MAESLPQISTEEELRRELRRVTELAGAPEPLHRVGNTADIIAPAFTNSWVNFDNTATTPGYGTNRDAAFYKDRGRVYLTGMIKTGATSTSAFTLPVGYRPKATIDFAVDAATDFAVLQVNSTGTVIPIDRGASAVTTFVFLDGVSFLAA